MFSSLQEERNVTKKCGQFPLCLNILKFIEKIKSKPVKYLGSMAPGKVAFVPSPYTHRFLSLDKERKIQRSVDSSLFLKEHTSLQRKIV
jgi:hypothetical protein